MNVDNPLIQAETLDAVVLREETLQLFEGDSLLICDRTLRVGRESRVSEAWRPRSEQTRSF